MSEFIIETEEFNIRKVMDSDYEAFGKIAAAEYLFGRMYEIDPELAKKVYWDTIVTADKDINYAVITKDNDLIGRVALQGIDMDVPELAIVIVKDYQGKGYGEKIIRVWLPWMHETMGYCRINIKIDSQNCRSIRLFQKLGAIVDHDGSEVECHILLPF